MTHVLLRNTTYNDWAEQAIEAEEILSRVIILVTDICRLPLKLIFIASHHTD